MNKDCDVVPSTQRYGTRCLRWLTIYINTSPYKSSSSYFFTFFYLSLFFCFYCWRGGDYPASLDGREKIIHLIINFDLYVFVAVVVVLCSLLIHHSPHFKRNVHNSTCVWATLVLLNCSPKHSLRSSTPSIEAYHGRNH